LSDLKWSKSTEWVISLNWKERKKHQSAYENI